MPLPERGIVDVMANGSVSRRGSLSGSSYEILGFFFRLAVFTPDLALEAPFLLLVPGLPRGCLCLALPCVLCSSFFSQESSGWPLCWLYL